MPICHLCHTAYAHPTYWEPPELCECGANDQPSREDYEPTEDELEARVAMIAAMVAVDRGGKEP